MGGYPVMITSIPHPYFAVSTWMTSSRKLYMFSAIVRAMMVLHFLQRHVKVVGYFLPLLFSCWVMRNYRAG